MNDHDTCACGCGTPLTEERRTDPIAAELAGEYAAENERLRARVARLEEALRFYADGNHFDRCDQDAWDTVSGEPQNWWCDEAGTANIEDGTLARAALEENDAPPQEEPWKDTSRAKSTEMTAAAKAPPSTAGNAAAKDTATTTAAKTPVPASTTVQTSAATSVEGRADTGSAGSTRRSTDAPAPPAGNFPRGDETLTREQVQQRIAELEALKPEHGSIAQADIAMYRSMLESAAGNFPEGREPHQCTEEWTVWVRCALAEGHGGDHSGIDPNASYERLRRELGGDLSPAQWVPAAKLRELVDRWRSTADDLFAGDNEEISAGDAYHACSNALDDALKGGGRV